MERIDEALASVENPDILTAILIETGAAHKKIPGFEPKMFWVSFNSAFLKIYECTILSCSHFFQYAEAPS